jgi:EpsI family protein
MDSMTRLVAFSLGALALLGAAGGAIVAASPVPEVPLARPLDTIPGSLDGWRGADRVPAAILPEDRLALDQLRRTYSRDGRAVWVAVAYYPYQAEGLRPPAVQLLYPHRGWSELETRATRISMNGSVQPSLPANLVLMSNPDGRVAVLYWYQLGRRTLASDHWYRGQLLYGRLINRRADGALVRLASSVPPDGEPGEAVTIMTRFLQAFYPALLDALPD